MTEWVAMFDCPIYLPQTEQSFVGKVVSGLNIGMAKAFTFWDGIELIKIGGHFPGSSILHLRNFLRDDVVLCGDTFFLSLIMQHFSVMYSYSNRIPLPTREIARIRERMRYIDFDEIYGFWPYQNLTIESKIVLMKALEKYQ